jgi:BTB/POZ domain
LQDFKCHKVILSVCSPVFEKMFCGNFKEAKMGPDEPIRLDKIDPLVFESAMRCVINKYNYTISFEASHFSLI